MKKVLFSLFVLGALVASCSDEFEIVNGSAMVESRAGSESFSDVSFPMEANLVYNKLLDSFW